MRYRRKSGPLTLIRLLLFLAVLLGLAYFLLPHRAQAPSPSSNANNGNAISNTVASNTPINNEGNANVNDAINSNASSLQVYSDDEFRFTVTYPAGFAATRSTSGTGGDRTVNVVFSHDERGATLVIAPLSLEGIIEESFSVSNKRSVTINGIQATRASGASAKDGSKLDLLYFEHSGRVFFLNGSADLVDSIGNTFHFLSSS